MARGIRILSSIASILLLSGAVHAHHGWTWYTGEALELTGTVMDTFWGNPHDRLTLRVGEETWDVWLGPPGRNDRAGFHKGMVEVGDEVTVYGHRHVDGKRFEMKTERVRFDGSLFNMYPERQ